MILTRPDGVDTSCADRTSPPTTRTPEPVLITPAIIAQMADRRRQIQALQAMIAERQGRSCNDGR